MPIDEQSRAIRRDLLTASDIPAILGIDPHRTAIDVWTSEIAPDKVNDEATGEDDDKSSYAMQRGHALEPLLVAWAAKKRRLVAAPNERTFIHASIPWLGATPDALAYTHPKDDDSAPVAVIEGKSVGRWHIPLWRQEMCCQCERQVRSCECGGGDDGGPDRYVVTVPARHVIAQVQVQLAVLGLNDGLVSAELPYEDMPLLFDVERDDELVGLILEDVERFRVDYVLKRVVPPSDVPSKIVNATKALFPKPKRKELLEADAADAVLVEEFIDTREALKRLDEEKDRLTARLMARIGESEGLRGDGFRALWRASQWGRRLDVRRVKTEAEKASSKRRSRKGEAA
jgi:predicted phage-related endonuclease